jgi:hypothetical protein
MQIDRKPNTIEASKQGVSMKEQWFPFVVFHGPRRLGVYWAANEKDAAAFARMESRSFGPVDLTGKRLTVTPK